MQGKSLSIDNLRKKGIIIVDWCCMQIQRESIDHLILIVDCHRLMDICVLSSRNELGNAKVSI